jgi:glycosyltransferase involved in cell wall biosynthesis
MPLISIITACYNHGIYLDEAFESVQLDKYKDIFEHIIVNDGSTDAFTLQKLNDLEQKGVKVIHQLNCGLAKARNAGIAIAEGKYILPLDSDNKIIPEVFLKALEMLEADERVSAVYTDAWYFGSRKNLWKIGELDIDVLLNRNYIDACALLRTKDIEEVGLYDSSMPYMGNEDWELWVNLLSKKKNILYLQEPGFYYRIIENSMSFQYTIPGYVKNKAYIFKKHADFVSNRFFYLLQKKEWVELNFSTLQNKLSNNRLHSILKILFGRKFY